MVHSEVNGSRGEFLGEHDVLLVKWLRIRNLNNIKAKTIVSIGEAVLTVPLRVPYHQQRVGQGLEVLGVENGVLHELLLR